MRNAADKLIRRSLLIAVGGDRVGLRDRQFFQLRNRRSVLVMLMMLVVVFGLMDVVVEVGVVGQRLHSPLCF